jgi:mono/diheme cytochrome c family protein
MSPMWKCKLQQAIQSSATLKKASRSRHVAFCLALTAFCFASVGCRRDMQDQPKMRPYRSTSFFGDGLSARPPVPGTVPRGFLRTDREFFTGKKNTQTGSTGSQSPAAQPAVSPGQNATSTNVTSQNAVSYPDAVDTFPFAITEQILARGKERYEIFCSVCHGLTGYGDGMIVRRGFRRAASYHDDRLRQAPVGHFFDVVTNGWGAMPSYAAQIPAQDRWAIIAYIRALQYSQQNKTNVAPSQPQASPDHSGGHQ